MNAVLVLNSGKNELGQPAPDTSARIDAAAEFTEANNIDMLVMVGGDVAMMSNYLGQNHPGAMEPETEGASQDTLEGAHFVKLKFLIPRTADLVHIFTSDFHAPRTDWTYRNVLGPSFNVKTHSVPSTIPAGKEPIVRNRERIQFAVARLKLAGLGPEDDEQRAKRIEHFRYRGRNNLLAKFLVRADQLTNVKRY